MELDMTKGSPAKLIARFIVPIIIGNVFQQLYNMVDTIIVGRFVGVDALAAAFVAANMLSYVGVCMANASAWVMTGLFLWVAYRVRMKKLSGDAQTKVPLQTSTEHSQAGSPG